MGCALSTERRADEAARPRGKAGSSGTHPSNAVVTRDEASSGAGVSRLSVNVAAKPALAATSPPAVSHAARYAIATPSPSCSRGAADAPAFNPSPLCRAVRSSRQRMAMSPTRHPSKSDPRVLERASSGTVMPFTDVAARRRRVVTGRAGNNVDGCRRSQACRHPRMANDQCIVPWRRRQLAFARSGGGTKAAERCRPPPTRPLRRARRGIRRARFRRRKPAQLVRVTPHACLTDELSAEHIPGEAKNRHTMQLSPPLFC
mmetsp:Transcript_10320/g.31925  ORF Transcript_10320/g.31925 Transcript_10320/m.31925 type:complete len:260 (+) Transcript_10320:65-844(+)